MSVACYLLVVVGCSLFVVRRLSRFFGFCRWLFLVVCLFCLIVVVREVLFCVCCLLCVVCCLLFVVCCLMFDL